MRIDRTHILILNYNGRELLRDCLPSILEAADQSPVPCRVSIVDNGSSDGSAEAALARWPRLGVFRQPNRGLASFNQVLPLLDEPVVLLLNNDVKLDPGAVGPLLDSFRRHPDALFSAPLCWTFDGRDYEGMRTRVRSRFGMVQGMCRVPGHEQVIHRADLTAAAGPVLAVDRRRFLELGGYDTLYFPGRIEDLDLGFRLDGRGSGATMSPSRSPTTRDSGASAPELGAERCSSLAIRNSFLFAWKNLDGARLAAHLCWIPARLGCWLARGRLDMVIALFEALRRVSEVRSARRAVAVGHGSWVLRQEAFFRRFAW